MVSEVDHHVGRILDCLDRTGLRDDTIVVFSSDHGEFLGELLHYGKGYPAPDCISRVPMIIRWPNGIAEPGRTVSHISEAVDLVPSLLEWAGIPGQRHLPGRPLAVAPNAGATRSSALTEMLGSRSLRTDRFRYVARADGSEFLYDVDEPMGQYRSVTDQARYAQALADVRRELRQRLIGNDQQRPRTVQY